MDGKTKALLCVQQTLEHKALDLVLLDVKAISSFADYFLICSGRSSRQVQGIADRLEEALREKGIRPLGIEGRREGHWVLMDYGDVIVHIFYEPTRSVYDLESLWSEAKLVDLGFEGTTVAVPSGQPA
jgi:ribosome-associated protein